MAIPVGAHGTATYNTKAKPNSKGNKTAIRNAKAQADSYNRNRGQDQSYLAELRAMLQGGMGNRPGGVLPRSGGNRSGGADSGPSAWEKFQIEEEKRKQRELEMRKAALTQQLTGARDQARPLLQQYNQQYNNDISGIFRQNRGLNSGYNQQLTAVQRQMNNQARGQQGALTRDLQGQGGGASDLQAIRAASGQQMAGTNLMSLLGQQYNTRLAQVMAQRQADAQAMGAATKASSAGQLENSYAQLLAQIGMIGLGT